MVTPPIKRARGEHGPAPLSVRTRRRMLSALVELAEDGNVPAMESLARLSFETEIAMVLKPHPGNAAGDPQQDTAP